MHPKSKHMQLHVTVAQPTSDKSISLKLQVHRAESVSGLLMEPDEFYQEWRPDKALPTFPHHEIEIIDMACEGIGMQKIWDQHYPKLHIHTPVGTQRRFICYTPDVPDHDELNLVVEMWAIGSFWAILNGTDFAGKFPQALDPARMSEFVNDPPDEIECKLTKL